MPAISETEGWVDALMVTHYVPGKLDSCGWSTGGEWQCAAIHTGNKVGQYSSLALDGAENLHIAFHDKGGNGDLWYATSGSGVNCGPGGDTRLGYPLGASAADVGQYASMGVDNSYLPYIACCGATNGKLMHAVDVEGGGNCGVLGSWQCEEIDSIGTGSHTRDVSWQWTEPACQSSLITCISLAIHSQWWLSIWRDLPRLWRVDDREGDVLCASCIDGEK